MEVAVTTEKTETIKRNYQPFRDGGKSIDNAYRKSRVKRMDREVWLVISIIGYIFAGLFFITAVIMFYKLKIPAVIGDLSGRTAAKQIQEIRERNARTGTKVYKPAIYNLERGKLTEPVTHTERQTRKTVAENIGSRDELTRTGQEEGFRSHLVPITSMESKPMTTGAEKRSVSEVAGTVVLHHPEASSSMFRVWKRPEPVHKEMAVIADDTAFPAENDTERLDENGTVVLDETVVLETAEKPEYPKPASEGAPEFKIIKDLKVIHTNERIQ